MTARLEDVAGPWARVSSVADDAALLGWLVRSGESSKDEGTTTFTASKAEPDRAMDVIVQNWRLENYRNNPVILDNHNHTRVVGMAEDARVPRDVGSLQIRVKWDLDNPDPSIRAVGWQHLNEFRRAGSVGFRAGKRTKRDKLPKDHVHYQEPIEVESDWGGKYTISGTLFERPELLEFSSATIPMLPSALQRDLMSWVEQRTDDPVEAVRLASREQMPRATADGLVAAMRSNIAVREEIVKLVLGDVRFRHQIAIECVQHVDPKRAVEMIRMRRQADAVRAEELAAFQRQQRAHHPDPLLEEVRGLIEGDG